MITIQNADAALKDYYLDAVSAQLNEGISPFFTAIEKGTDYVYGKDVKLAVVRGNAGNVKAGAEDGKLPGPHKNRYVNITLPLKNIYGTIEISDKAIRASRDSSGAFVNLLNAEMDGLISSAKQNFQRMLFGDGSGKLFTVTDTVSDYVYKVDKVKEYYVGMQVEIKLKNGNFSSDGAATITDVDLKAKTVTFDIEFVDLIKEGSAYVQGSYNNEITGLGAIFDGTSLYGVSKATDKYFLPYKVDASKAALTETALSDVIDHMEENYNSRINMILCSYATRKKIASLINANRRVVNTIDAYTGYGAVTVNNIPVYADKYCPDDRILFLNSDDFGLYQLCDWEWLEDEDGKILKQIPGKAAYTATLVKYAELVCRKPCGQAMLHNFS
ncbi:MAG: phage major capsid protein [Clostridia bacterium]|nr:phage major capsid protein [Clostridia bacterium]